MFRNAHLSWGRFLEAQMGWTCWEGGVEGKYAVDSLDL